MTNFFNHLVWFFCFFLFFLVSFVFSFYLSFLDGSFSIYIGLFNLSFLDGSFSIYVDSMSSWFTSCIIFISSVVMVFSYSYMSPSFNTLPFLWLTTLFVFSMLLVVNCSDLLFTMLGWDGLGLISFFLITFYQNQTSVTSGLFTLMINRLGDSFFILIISVILFSFQSFDFFSFYFVSSVLSIFLVLTFITKSAIFPFSSWLPAAIAAPTPISALVHSSTLVASGLFLIMRFSYLIYSSFLVVNILLILSVFTSFYAGLNSLFEVDINKLIALSTLSHLGFIGLAFSCGFLNLSLLHILAHALFKSLLFMCMGDIIHFNFHTQDIRHLGSGVLLTPFSCMVINSCLANLLGLPMLSGFFSNDLVLESIVFSSFSYILILIVYFNVFFTYYYTYTLFVYSSQPTKSYSFYNVHSSSFIHFFLLCILSFTSFFASFLIMNITFNTQLFLVVAPYLNFFPPFVNLVFFLFILLNNNLFTFLSVNQSDYFSSMMFLTNTVSCISSFMFLNTSSFSTNTGEEGFFYSVFNSSFYESVSFVSSNILVFSSNSYFIFILFSFLFLPLIMAFF